MKKTAILVTFFVSVFTSYSQTSAKIDELLNAYTRLHRFNGSVLVAEKGNIIIEKGYGLRNVATGVKNDPHSTYEIASVTKTFTSGMILMLVQKGKLSLEDHLSRWYPDFPNAGIITIRHLLSHTSGLFDYTRRENDSIPVNTPSEMMAFLKKMPLDFEPGTQFRYSNSGYSVLGFIIAKITGIHYERAVRQYIFSPLGMYHSGFDFKRLKSPGKTTGYALLQKDEVRTAGFIDSNIVYSAGAIYSTTGDLYKWHKALQSHKLVNKALLDTAYIPVQANYGLGWIIDSMGDKKLVYHSGNIAGYSSVLFRVPGIDRCIVLLNNREGSELETMARQINDILDGKPVEVPREKKAVVLSNTILQRYTGTYEIPDLHLTIHIVIENDQLVSHAVNGPSFLLTPESETRFFIQEGQAVVEFKLDASGKAASFILEQNNQVKEGKRIQ